MNLFASRKKVNFKSISIFLVFSLLLTPVLSFAQSMESAIGANTSTSIQAPQTVQATDTSVADTSDSIIPNLNVDTNTNPANGESSSMHDVSIDTNLENQDVNKFIDTESTKDKILLDTNDQIKAENTDLNLDTSQMQEAGVAGPSGSSIDGLSPPEPQKQTKPGVDVPTGSLTYNYEFNVPQGRNGLTPKIALNYNSQSTKEGSAFGYGFNIDIPYIERVNRHGSEKLYTVDDFSSSLSGELVLSSGSVFIPRSENGDFNQYNKSANGWTVVGKDGKIYSYGISSNSRQDDPNNSSNVYKWMLEKVEDTNGNYISYTYYKDQGQIYPSEITYTNSTNTLAGSSGLYKISFVRDSRTDVLDSYASAFKVTTAYKTKQIKIEVNNVIRGTYDIVYTTGNNTQRSLLSTVTETRYSDTGVSTTMSPIVFEYTSGQAPFYYNGKDTLYVNNFFPSNYLNNGLVTGDVNGDSYTDVVQAYEWVVYPGYTQRDTFVFDPNTNKFNSNTTYQPPSGVTNYTEWYWGSVDRGSRIVDLNGDLKNDILMTPYSYGGVTKNREDNNGNGWTNIAYNTTNIKYYPDYVDNPWYSMFVQDINGDSLPDVLQDTDFYWNGSNNNYKTRTSLNKGGEFDFLQQNFHSGSGTIPYTYTPSFTGKNTYFMMDINSDGLPDIIQAHSTLQGCGNCQYQYTHNVYINTGKDWVLDNSYTLPVDFAYYVNAWYGDYINPIEIGDFNNDGFQDIWNLYGAMYINKGKSFDKLSDPNSNLSSISYGLTGCYKCHNPYITMDYDGDGDQDYIRTSIYPYPMSSTSSIIYKNTLTQPNDAIKKIKLPSGANYDFTYKASAQYKDSNNNLLNPKLPINMQTVSTVVENDGIGNSTTTSYEYADGSYYYAGPYDRKFAGFGKVTKTNPDGTKEVTYYSQANTTDTASGEYDDHVSKISKPYRTDVYSSSGTLVKQDTTKWAKSQIGSINAYFVYPSQTVSRVFSSSGSYDTASSYVYDTSNGNLNSKTDYGEVVSSGYQSFTDISNDATTTEYNYTACAGVPACTRAIFPSQIVVKDSFGNIASKTKLYYDNLAFGNASIGNNTKEENYKTSTVFTTSTKSYNAYGMPISITDKRGNTTSIVYDSYYMYPQSITNALSQATSYTYDYNSGKVKEIVDPNGTITQADYDGFGRVLALRTSSDTSLSSLITKVNYQYNDTMGAGGALPYVKKVTNYSPTFSGESYILYDGLMRKVREVSQTALSSFMAKDTVNNNMGQVAKESIAYNLSSTPTVYTGPNTTANLYTNYTYDTLGRVTMATNSLGSTTNTYNKNKLSTTDQNGKQKSIFTDAFNNIVKVEEYNNGSTYTTKYSWNTLNKLTKIEDALGNVRNFEYDFLGRKTKSEDLHDPVDTDFGVYYFTYDNENNLTAKTTPNGASISYAYDALSRITNESLSGVTQIAYTYDICPNGVGKLCSVARTGSGNKSFAYTTRGLTMFDNITITPRSLGMQYVYDYQGNIIELTYPDGSKVRYTYDNAGKIIAIDTKENLAPTWNSAVNSVTYNALGQKTAISYANGRNEYYDYDQNRMFTLSRLRVDAAPGPNPNLQDFNYTFDNVGNVTALLDNTTTGNARNFAYTYDDLYRLTSASLSVNPPATGYTENYTYNAIGNIVTKSGAGSYTYGGTNAGSFVNPHAAITVGANTYTYDNNGNLTGWGSAPTNTTLNYNYRNELISYTRLAPPNPVMNTYLYDESSARIKTVDTQGTTYSPSKYYDETITGTNTKKKKNIYLGNLLVATIEKNNTAPANPTYIHHDHLGGTTLVTDAGGAVAIQKLEYYPFGEIRSNITIGPGIDQKNKFTGHDYDADTNLNYMGARYQYGVEGRFWAQDPVSLFTPENFLTDPQQFNMYSYGRNNPIKYVDPDGKAATLFNSWSKESFGYFNGQLEPTYQATKNTVNTVSDFTPIVGDFKAGSEAITGRNSISGEKLSNGDRALAAFSAIPIAGSIGDATKAVKNTEKVTDTVKGFNHDGTYHGLNQIINRKISPSTIKETILNPLKKTIQNDGRTKFFSEKAIIVIDKAGQVVTGIDKNNFTQKTQNFVNSLLSKKN